MSAFAGALPYVSEHWGLTGNMEPRDFETLVRSMIKEQLDCSDGDVHERRALTGKRTGYEHEIDLSFECSLLGTRLLVIVECKAYGRPVSVDDVMEFSSRIDDIGAHKGILVSASGFTKGAEQLANGHGIALVHALLGKWIIIGRFTGAPPSRWSNTLFHLTLRPIVIDNVAFLKLSPIDEVDMISVAAFDQTSAVHGAHLTRAVFRLASSGGPVPSRPGLIPLTGHFV